MMRKLIKKRHVSFQDCFSIYFMFLHFCVFVFCFSSNFCCCLMNFYISFCSFSFSGKEFNITDKIVKRARQIWHIKKTKINIKMVKSTDIPGGVVSSVDKKVDNLIRCRFEIREIKLLWRRLAFMVQLITI